MRRAYRTIFVAKVNNLAFVESAISAKRIKRILVQCGRGAAAQSALCALLVVSLLATSTPAAPGTFVAVAGEWKAELSFWLKAKDFPGTWYRALAGQNPQHAKPQEKQQERDARIARVEIQRGKRTIQVGEQLLLSAIAYDHQNVPVGGVSFQWRSDYQSPDQQDGLLPNGGFSASVAGQYVITAEIGGMIDSVKVRVLAKETNGNRPPIIRKVSSYSIDQPLTKYPGGVERAHAAAIYQTQFIDGDPLGWNSTNKPAAFSPLNERGETPGRSTVEANSNNFRIQSPVVSLPGRGLDLDLSLIYNSRLWSKANNANNEIVYDADRDQIAPGWSLNFGRLINMVDAGAFLIDENGTRHSFVGQVTIDPNNGERSFYGTTTDGSFIEYAVLTRGIGTGSVDTFGFAKYPNGLTVSFGGATSINSGSGNVYVLYTASINDNNGNYIRLNFGNGKLQNIVDTLGRVVTFHYDSNQLLIAITAAGLKDENGQVTNRTLVRLHYKQLSLNATFQGLTPVVTASTVWAIDAIYYPATKTGHWFADSDSYSSYGMIKRVSERKSMTFSEAPLNEQGTFQAGTVTREMVYDYPAGPVANLTDAPAYDTVTESWEGSTTGEAETQYEIVQEGDTRKVTTTLTDQTKTVEYSYVRPGQYDDGLVHKVEIREGANILRTTLTTWEVGYEGTPRVKRRDFTDERQQTSFQTYGYGEPSANFFNQLKELKEFDYGGNLLRKTTWTYDNHGYYIDRRLSGLPRNSRGRLLYVVTSVEVFAGDGTRAARTEYKYDEYDPNFQASGPYAGDLVDTPGVTNFDGFFDPYFFYFNYFFGGYRFRGNVTTIINYADAANLAGPISTVMTYDKTGNARTATTSGKQSQIVFNLDTQYAYPASVTIGSPDPNQNIRMTTSSTYDFNTGLELSATDPNSRATQNTYYLDSWRLKQGIAPTGANTLHEYDDVGLSVTRTTKGSDGTIADKSVTKGDGRGQAIRIDALASNDIWDTVETQYDDLGRTSKQTLPYRIGQTPRWNETFYDAFGRVTRKLAPDQSETKIFYNETARPSAASTTPGQTARSVDAWGRERWMLTNALGRAIEVVEPNPNGNGSVLASGSLLTKYSYNPLGKLIQVDQDAQQRRFRYDSLGRLTQQKLAEADATLNDAGQYVGNGQWSNVFAYDVRSNLIWRVDARGVKTNLAYNNDPLDRLQSISFDTNGADPGQIIHSAAPISYQYMPTGDITRIQSITASNVSTETYDYDSEGRIKEKTLVLSSRPLYPAFTEFIYDSLDRITDVRYPVQYGLLGNPRKLVHHDYDIASRLSGLKVDGADYASQIAYNAASQKTSLKVGTGTNQVTETYDYDPITLLLSRQRVQRAGATLLDLNYDYLREGTTSGRSGQLTKIINNLNNNRSRNYTYDALGRLIHARAGSASGPIFWTQTYSYDRYGNRLTVSSNGLSAWNRGFPSRKDWEGAQIAAAPPTATDDQQIAANEESGPVTSETVNGPTNLEWLDTPSEEFESETKAPVSRNEAKAKSRSTSRSHHASRSARHKAVNPTSPSPPTFTDDPLNDPQNPDKTPIKAVHMTELRDAINALRGLLGMSAYSWAESVSIGNFVKANHISEMRTALDQALGVPAGGYSVGLGQGLPILAIHVQELRDRIKTTWNSFAEVPRDGYTSLTYNTGSNRITTTGFEYDAAGNQTRVWREDGSAHYYEYDAANRVVKVRDQNGLLLASYTYGEGNKRLVAQNGDENSNQRTYYVWTAGVVMTEYTETPSTPTTPSWKRNYVYFGGRLLATQDVSGGGELVEYHHPDRLGTRILTRGDGSWTEQVTLPFGVALDDESTGGASNRRFTSYDRSAATGLDYAISRTYDSLQGRFNQVDPIGMETVALTNPQSLNLYSYCANDPINSVDPSGTDGWTISFGGFFGGGPGNGPGGGGLLGGLLGGLFNFGLGLLGTIFGSGGNSTFFGWPFLNFPRPPRGGQPPSGPTAPAPITLSVSGSFPQSGTRFQVPQDVDRTALEVLLGEASTPGESSWGPDAFGPQAYRNPTQTVAEWEVYGEMGYMVSVINNRLKDWGKTEGYSSWADVITKSKDFEGYGNGQTILKALEAGTAQPHQYERARIAVEAIRDFIASPFGRDSTKPFYYWKSIRQYRWITPKNGKPYKRYFITKKGNAFRIALTDFHHSMDRYK